MPEYNGTQREIKELLVQVTQMSTTLSNVEKDISELKKDLREQYVTRTEFEPVQRLVYGLVGLVLVAVVSALIGLVVIGQSIP